MGAWGWLRPSGLRLGPRPGPSASHYPLEDVGESRYHNKKVTSNASSKPNLTDISGTIIPLRSYQTAFCKGGRGSGEGYFIHCKGKNGTRKKENTFDMLMSVKYSFGLNPRGSCRAAEAKKNKNVLAQVAKVLSGCFDRHDQLN